MQMVEDRMGPEISAFLSILTVTYPLLSLRVFSQYTSSVCRRDFTQEAAWIYKLHSFCFSDTGETHRTGYWTTVNSVFLLCYTRSNRNLSIYLPSHLLND